MSEDVPPYELPRPKGGRPPILTTAEEARIRKAVRLRRTLTNEKLALKHGVSLSTIEGVIRRMEE
jgi:ribosomal protein S25